MSRQKRPAKQQVVMFMLSLFGLLKAGHLDQKTIGKQLTDGNMYLYEDEVQPLIDKTQEKEKDFDGEGFYTMLVEADAIEEGSRPSWGGGGGASVRINSKERALEVANSPEDADKVVELVSEVLAIRKRLNPLINEKAEFSIALKNKKKKETSQGEGTSPTPAEDDSRPDLPNSEGEFDDVEEDFLE